MFKLVHSDGREVRYPTLTDVEYFFGLGALRRDWTIVEDAVEAEVAKVEVDLGMAPAATEQVPAVPTADVPVLTTAPETTQAPVLAVTDVPALTTEQVASLTNEPAPVSPGAEMAPAQPAMPIQSVAPEIPADASPALTTEQVAVIYGTGTATSWALTTDQVAALAAVPATTEIPTPGDANGA